MTFGFKTIFYSSTRTPLYDLVTYNGTE